VLGVGAEVEQHLLELHPVAADDAVLLHRDAQVDGGGDRRAEQPRALLGDGADVDLDAARGVVPAEGVDLLDELAGAARGGEGLEEVGARGGRGGGGQVEQGELGEAHDGREEVVEIVGDAAGEGADGLHLLRLAEARLELALRREVADGGVDERAAAHRDGREEHAHRELGAVEAAGVPFEAVAALDEGEADLLGEAGVVGVAEEIRGGAADDGPAVGRAEERGGGGVAVDHPLAVEQHLRVGRAVEEELELPLALRERLLHHVPVGDVDAVADVPDEVAVPVEHRHARVEEPAVAPVVTPQPVLDAKLLAAPGRPRETAAGTRGSPRP
jgi:hypothetical protein